jgi:hypothetical protein
VVVSGGGAIGFAGPQHGGDNPCCFVGDGNRWPVETVPLPKVIDPLVLPVMLIRRLSTTALAPCTSRRRKCWLPRFKIPSSPACRPGVLSGNQPEPSGQVAPILEVSSIADSSYHRGGRLRPDALDPGNPLTSRIGLKYRIDLLVDRCDAAIQIAR